MRLVPAVVPVLVLALASASAVAQDESKNDPKAEPAAAQAPAQQRPAQQPPAPPEPTREELEKKFAETMTGATLVGHFTATDRPGQPKEDRYTITRVTKQKGDTWLFLARMQFGGRDLTVPMLIPVKWAGDTAVISVTRLGIPGLGTYSARVLIYEDQYAGTWTGTNHGGHLWGRIERTADAGGSADTAAGEKKPDAEAQKQGQ